jgi:hypothetical protein
MDELPTTEQVGHELDATEGEPSEPVRGIGPEPTDSSPSSF